MRQQQTLDGCIELPAVSGIQAGRQYYTVMCPLHAVTKLFQYSDSSLPPDVRAQRVLNKQRVPEMCNYILDNVETYVFSALTASVDGDIKFVADKDKHNIGILKIALDSRIILNDGQHRHAAINAALKKNPAIRNEDISIVIYHDSGLMRSQQMFTDLNRHAVRPTKSLNILFDNRDPFSIVIKNCIENTPVFKDSVEKEKSTISNRSPALFTLSGIYSASQSLIKGFDLSLDEQQALITEFWTEVSEHIKPWQEAKNRAIKPEIFRQDYMCAHTIALKALGVMGNELIRAHPNAWKEKLFFLDRLDWLKTNAEFQGLVLLNQRISSSRNNQEAFANYFKVKVDLPTQEGVPA